MKVRDLAWRRYSLPFVAPFRTAHGTTGAREGLILRLTGDDGLLGLGETPYLPEFGGASIDEIERVLQSLAPKLLECDLDQIWRRISSLLADQPALICALDTALLDLESKRRGVRLAELLGPNPANAVLVNATIGGIDSGATALAARQAVECGFGTVKLKVGVCASIEEEVGRVSAVRAAIGANVALRLDANGAWEPERAIVTLDALRECDIELIEQPVADLDGMVAIRRSVGIPIAADEAVTGLESARRIVDAGAADVLVIKLAVCGGLRAARSIIELAENAGLKTIVTSLLESGIGVAAALHLAATLPSGSPACGLATLSLLSEDLVVESLAQSNGTMPLPEWPGLGVTLDEDRLDDSAGTNWQRASGYRLAKGRGWAVDKTP